MDDELEAVFLEIVNGKGGHGKFSQEEMEKSDEWCKRFCGKIGAMERITRRERAIALSKPAIILN